jgi:RNA polymerase sigma factor (sigma-70 family)
VGHTSVIEPTAARGATPAQIEAVYRARYPELVRVARAILGDADAAHDAVQDGVARALRGRAGYRGTGSLEAWIWRAVVNAARSARSRHVVHELPRERAAAPAADTDAQLRGAVAALPERQRLAVFLRHYADLDYGSIAEALEVAPGTVGATLSAAYSTLRTRLEEIDR